MGILILSSQIFFNMNQIKTNKKFLLYCVTDFDIVRHILQ